MLRCHTSARTATVSRWKTTFGASQGRKNLQIGGARSVERNYDWKQPDRLLVVQTGESVDQAKVCRAHAVPQGLCGNLKNALKLPANQQEDGDGFAQNVAGRGSRTD